MNIFNFSRALLLAALLTSATAACKKTEVSPIAQPDVAAEQRAIQQLLDAYGAALNASDAAKITPLFAQDALFIAPGAPTATGTAQIRAAFDGLFGAVALKLQFTPAQIVVANTNYAYATSTSSGTLTPKASGQPISSAYRELWAFSKEGGQWKIARYMFNQPAQ